MVQYIIALILLFSSYQIPQSKASEQKSLIGPISFLDIISQESYDQYQRLIKNIKKEPIKYDEIAPNDIIFINPIFLTLLFLYSDDSYVSMSRFNSCNFLALIQLRKIKGPQGLIDKILIDIKNKKETRSISIEDFLKVQYSKECFSNLEIAKIYQSNSLLEEALKAFKINIPKTDDECKKIHKDFFKQTDSIYLCNLIESQSKSNILNKILSSSSQFFLEKICLSATKEEDFCKTYKTNSYWNKILAKEKDITPLTSQCIGILKKTNIEQKDYGKCLSLMDKDPSLCLFNNSFLFPSLTPHPNCKEISNALLDSRLYMGYKDCPALLDNDGITSTFRILYHYLNGQEKSTETLYPLKDYINNCKSHPLSLFANLALKQSNNNIWKFEICYNDPIESKNICYPTNAWEWVEDPLSEPFIVEKIIKRLKPAPKNLSCSFLSSDKYKPHLLSYKKGCYIIYDANNCTGMDCPKKVVYEGKNIEDIQFHTGTLFDYFPSSIQKNHYALSNIIRDNIKSNSYSKEIRNSTQLKFILNLDEKNIIHGQACAEDLLPNFFYKRSFNQCSPLTFIIDGYQNKEGKDFVIIRTSIDDIHSPRILPWTQIFNSVKIFSELHPMKSWTLYAIKK